MDSWIKDYLGIRSTPYQRLLHQELEFNINIHVEPPRSGKFIQDDTLFLIEGIVGLEVSVRAEVCYTRSQIVNVLSDAAHGITVAEERAILQDRRIFADTSIIPQSYPDVVINIFHLGFKMDQCLTLAYCKDYPLKYILLINRVGSSIRGCVSWTYWIGLNRIYMGNWSVSPGPEKLIGVCHWLVGKTYNCFTSGFTGAIMVFRPEAINYIWIGGLSGPGIKANVLTTLFIGFLDLTHLMERVYCPLSPIRSTIVLNSTKTSGGIEIRRRYF